MMLRQRTSSLLGSSCSALLTTTPATTLSVGGMVMMSSPFGGRTALLSTWTSASGMGVSPDKIRNVAIVAHVDHGKTTLMDKLLFASGTVRKEDVTEERVMDSFALEKERGITIRAKATSILWKDHVINIVDTPGHADFGGEVERSMSMVDGVALVVDALEGVMTQTKFTLSKALAAGLSPIVVINKMDRQGAREEDVQMDVFELFANLKATESQLAFPTVFASARNGWGSADLAKARSYVKSPPPNLDMADLLDLFISHVPAPKVDPTAHFAMVVNQLSMHPHFGRSILGRIASGSVSVNDNLKALDSNGKVIDEGRLIKMFARKGMDIVDITTASAGEIVSLVGFDKATVCSTVCHPSVTVPLKSIPLDPPTVAITIRANDSPLAGRDGRSVTSNMVWERLRKEVATNIALQLDAVDGRQDLFVLKGRGELQLGVVLEEMRREGFELSVSPPEVVITVDERGQKMEPLEEVIVDVDTVYAGTVIEKLTLRKAEVMNFEDAEGQARSRITLLAPARALIGYRVEFQNDTHGSGVLNHIFHSFVPYKGAVKRVEKGAIISMADGKATAYALEALEPRGKLFITPGTEVYAGMIIGEHTRDNDLEVNPVQTKKLSNMRSVMKDEFVKLAPVKPMTLEEAIGYCRDDEVLEITPVSVRLRKAILDPNERKKAKAKKG